MHISTVTISDIVFLICQRIRCPFMFVTPNKWLFAEHTLSFHVRYAQQVALCRTVALGG